VWLCPSVVDLDRKFAANPSIKFSNQKLGKTSRIMSSAISGVEIMDGEI
jgi:hypothetical protein